MITLFWKKLVILNIGLFIIILRMYDLGITKFAKYIDNRSIFPMENDDGYPYIDEIDCNLKTLFSITHQITNITNDQNKINSPISNINSCSYKTIFLLCKGDIECENNLMCNNSTYINLLTEDNYHSDKEFNGSIFWEYITNLNNYEGDFEMDFLYKIFSGYHSYINLLLIKDKDYEQIKDKVTSSYESVNNLIYLQSLFLKAVINSNRDNYQKKYDAKNKAAYALSPNNIEKFYNRCLTETVNFLGPFISDKIKEQTFNILDRVEKAISCINEDDIKQSSFYDLKNIETLIKINFGYEVSNEEINLLEAFSNKISSQLDKVYLADNELKKQSDTYSDYLQYFYILFIGSAITSLLFINKYFINDRKNQNGKYYHTTKKYPNENNLKQLKKQLRIQNEAKMSASTGVPFSSFSKIEQEYINKLLADQEKDKKNK